MTITEKLKCEHCKYWEMGIPTGKCTHPNVYFLPTDDHMVFEDAFEHCPIVNESSNEKLTWVVGIDRPYYPDIKFFHDDNEANGYYEKLKKEEPDVNGENKSRVFIAKLKDFQDILTDY